MRWDHAYTHSPSSLVKNGGEQRLKIKIFGIIENKGWGGKNIIDDC